MVEAQGYASRARNGTAADVLAAVRRLGCVQLDSISTVERSHRIVLGARVGAYPEPAIAELMRTGRIFEYWAHEACLVPIEDYRMHRWRMEKHAESHPWRGNVFEQEPELTAQVLREIAERGPLASRHFEGSGPGGMWTIGAVIVTGILESFSWWAQNQNVDSKWITAWALGATVTLALLIRSWRHRRAAIRELAERGEVTATSAGLKIRSPIV